MNEWEVMTELQIPTTFVRLHFVLHDSVDDMSGPVCRMRKPQWFEKWSSAPGGEGGNSIREHVSDSSLLT